MIDKHGEILCHNRNVKRENKWAWQAVLSTSSQVSVGAKSIDQTKRGISFLNAARVLVGAASSFMNTVAAKLDRISWIGPTEFINAGGVSSLHFIRISTALLLLLAGLMKGRAHQSQLVYLCRRHCQVNGRQPTTTQPRLRSCGAAHSVGSINCQVCYFSSAAAPSVHHPSFETWAYGLTTA